MSLCSAGYRRGGGARARFVFELCAGDRLGPGRCAARRTRRARPGKSSSLARSPRGCAPPRRLSRPRRGSCSKRRARSARSHALPRAAAHRSRRFSLCACSPAGPPTSRFPRSCSWWRRWRSPSMGASLPPGGAFALRRLGSAPIPPDELQADPRPSPAAPPSRRARAEHQAGDRSSSHRCRRAPAEVLFRASDQAEERHRLGLPEPHFRLRQDDACAAHGVR